MHASALDKRLREPPPYRPSQVAQIFGVDPSTVRRWIKRGQIQAITTPSGARRIPQAEVARFLEATNGGRISTLSQDPGTGGETDTNGPRVATAATEGGAAAARGPVFSEEPEEDE